MNPESDASTSRRQQQAVPTDHLAGKVALVTGGSRGLGLEIARLLLQAGCRVAICSRQDDALQTAVSSLGATPDDLLGVRADVSVEADVVRLFAEVEVRFQRIDILVNNAANFDGGPVDDVTLEQWNNVLGACLTGPFLCTRQAFRSMKLRNGGRILNIGSISAQRSRPDSTPYTAAKFGVWGLTQASALEGRSCGIVVSCLHPGNILVDWRRQTSDGREAEPMMDVTTVARAAVTMLALPPEINFLEGILLPTEQQYLGRG